jgi:hypothetical protein
VISFLNCCFKFRLTKACLFYENIFQNIVLLVNKEKKTFEVNNFVGNIKNVKRAIFVIFLNASSHS